MCRCPADGQVIAGQGTITRDLEPEMDFPHKPSLSFDAKSRSNTASRWVIPPLVPAWCLGWCPGCVVAVTAITRGGLLDEMHMHMHMHMHSQS